MEQGWQKNLKWYKDKNLELKKRWKRGGFFAKVAVDTEENDSRNDFEKETTICDSINAGRRPVLR